MIEEVLVGHGPCVAGSHPGQHGVPAKCRCGGVGLAAALAGLLTRGVDFLEHFLPFRLPVAQAAREQGARQHNAPVPTFLADADVDELRIEHHLAEAFFNGVHGCGCISGARQADRLHVDHGVTGAGHRLLKVTGAFRRQRQAGVAVERGQFQRALLTTGLRLAAVDVDGRYQLCFFARDSQCLGGNDQP